MEEISVFVAEGYEDRDYVQCQTRMKTLISAYRRFIDGQRKTGMNKAKKPFCFDTLDSITGNKPTSRPSNLVSSLPLQLGSESWLSPNSPTSANLGLDEDKEQESKELYEDDNAFGKNTPLTTTDGSVTNTPSASAEHLLELGSSVTIGTSSSNKLPHLSGKENKTEKQSKSHSCKKLFFSK